MEEFIHEFSGFHGIPSRCHIRIIDEKNKPLVVMCSQVFEGAGTSVTNMAEDIAQDVKNYLERDNFTLASAIAKYIRRKRFSEMLGDLVNGLKRTNKYSIFALESIKLALEYTEKYKGQKDRLDGFVWVEHYAAGIFSIVPEDRYSIVTFDQQSWRPNWIHCNVEFVAMETGYPKSFFKSPKESIKS